MFFLYRQVCDTLSCAGNSVKCLRNFIFPSLCTHQLQHEAYWNFILQNFMKTCWATLILFVADNFNCLTRQPTWVYVCTCPFCTVTLRITCSVHMHYILYHLNSVCQKWKSILQQHCCNQSQWELHTYCSTAANVSRWVDTL